MISTSLNDSGKQTEANFTAGLLDPVHISNTYDSLLRRMSNTMLVNGTARNTVAFGYDALSGRLGTVTKDDAYRASYGYTPGIPEAVRAVTHEVKNGGNWVTHDTGVSMYDVFDRLSSIAWYSGTGGSGSTVLSSSGYTYNAADQRTRVDQADGTHWLYTYDSLGQVTGGKRYTGADALIPGEQFGYAFDAIGNRVQTTVGGKVSGEGLRAAAYFTDSQNKYTSRGTPGAAEIMGARWDG